MSKFRAALVVLALVATATCGSSPQAPTAPNTGTGGSGTDSNTITGTEHVGWTQAAASLDAARAFTYLMYVDASPTALTGVTCQAAASAGSYNCTAPLPRLTSGRHELTISATDTAGAESAQSAPIIVTVR